MPLRDHFRPPWSDENPWEGFHSAWVNTLVRHLNGQLLPPHFRAFPQVHLGPYVETDVATFERLAGAGASPSPAGAAPEEATELWSPPAAVQTLDVEWPGQEVFEVRVGDARRGMRLVAAIELVSPGNKDRPEERHAFAAKCAAYLREQVGVVVVDIVTTRHANLHAELLELLAAPLNGSSFPGLYCVSYRNRNGGPRASLDLWPFPLAVGSPLPEAIPLWIGARTVPVDLERSYQETCQVLRIDGAGIG
jgi:hypothetical protein